MIGEKKDQIGNSTKIQEPKSGESGAVVLAMLLEANTSQSVTPLILRTITVLCPFSHRNHE